MMEKKMMIVAAALVVIVLAGAAFAGFYLSNQSQSTQPAQTTLPTESPTSQSAPIQVVAGENFWGSLVSQLGGSRTQILSIVTDPNADPHEYESNSQDAQAIANAALVIVNGAGYDDWALKLIAASNAPHQIVLNVANLLGKKEGDNPHFWYSPTYVNETVKAMYNDLTSIDPADTSYFTQQYTSLNASLGVYNSRISEIRTQFAGRKVASTESIFDYLANATGLDVVSPPAFMDAVAEGNDPPAQSVVQFQQLLQNGTVTVLVYNAQTVTPLTQSIKALAASKGIPIVAVTETIQPSDVSFQVWMNAELIALQNALNAQALGE
jgi:zinc/manganese transport system substrate-binding protein